MADTTTLAGLFQVLVNDGFNWAMYEIRAANEPEAHKLALSLWGKHGERQKTSEKPLPVAATEGNAMHTGGHKVPDPDKPVAVPKPTPVPPLSGTAAAPVRPATASRTGLERAHEVGDPCVNAAGEAGTWQWTRDEWVCVVDPAATSSGISGAAQNISGATSGISGGSVFPVSSAANLGQEAALSKAKAEEARRMASAAAQSSGISSGTTGSGSATSPAGGGRTTSA